METLNAFNRQLTAKINNGQISDPAATDLQDASAQIEDLILALLDNV